MNLLKYPSRSESIFFGQTDTHREVFLEQAFLLQYYLGMSYSDCRNLPVPYRKWFIDRIIKEKKDEAQAASPSPSMDEPLQSQHERELFGHSKPAQNRSKGPKTFK